MDHRLTWVRAWRYVADVWAQKIPFRDELGFCQGRLRTGLLLLPDAIRLCGNARLTVTGDFRQMCGTLAHQLRQRPFDCLVLLRRQLQVAALGHRDPVERDAREPLHVRLRTTSKASQFAQALAYVFRKSLSVHRTTIPQFPSPAVEKKMCLVVVEMHGSRMNGGRGRGARGSEW
jgi:hypothetical protein